MESEVVDKVAEQKNQLPTLGRSGNQRMTHRSLGALRTVLQLLPMYRLQWSLEEGTPIGHHAEQSFQLDR